MAIASGALARVPMLLLAGLLLSGAQGRTTGLEDRLLASHNRERAALGVAPLQWDPSLARGAAQWAEHLSQTGRFEHSPKLPGTPREGENIWGGRPGAFTPEAMVNLWIAEKAHFVPGTFPNNSKTGRVEDVSHYTQLVWRRTAQVGCALSRAGEEEILVCRYSVPGNVRGREPL